MRVRTLVPLSLLRFANEESVAWLPLRKPVMALPRLVTTVAVQLRDDGINNINSSGCKPCRPTIKHSKLPNRYQNDLAAFRCVF
jgi:hypothetical protein